MHKKLVEAALFMAGKPLDLNELSKITGINSLGYVKDILKKLEKEYADRGIEIIASPRGWDMQVRQELLPQVAHLTPYKDMSEGAKRSLALIVAKEPVTQSELIKIQGNKAYSYIKGLEKMGLVKTQKHRRSRVITLTAEFERYFGAEKEKIKQALQEELGRRREKVHDFIDSQEKETEEQEVKKLEQTESAHHAASEEKKKKKAKAPADSGEIPW
jgi:segregation and condensation protein B